VLLGSMRWEDAGGPTVGGMLQELVPQAQDAWEYALATGRPYFAAPRDREPDDAFAADAAQLGRVTRAMHEALASDATHQDFAPEVARETTVARWAAHARRQVGDAIALLERQVADGAVVRDRLEEARVVVRRRGDYLALVDEIAAEVEHDAGQCIRHHGDYHLGQVLRTAAGEFMVIDFEGEPARPLEERRARHSALRDVAGMLRSFSYAAATLAGEARRSGRGATDPATVEIRAGRWERDARSRFLDAYFSGARASFLPRKPANARRLLSLFEIEKVFYELGYELNNRPDWVAIPLRGVARLTTVSGAR
jgi:maltose alpha-D-glucosyltransferase/alpha-amylase